MNLVTLIGSVVRDVGNGNDSTRVSFSSGRFDSSDAGRSVGEHATMTCRRCVFVEKKERFSE